MSKGLLIAQSQVSLKKILLIQVLTAFVKAEAKEIKNPVGLVAVLFPELSCGSLARHQRIDQPIDVAGQ